MPASTGSALSFIQRPEDIAEAKKITRGRAAVMAKIEKPQAVARLAEIMDFTDALMVARGDLGVEMPLEKVPGIQKQITRAARRAGKPVVVATQMLESMITNPVPTRAEVSDVATAIFEGADAVMLSAESAAGQYPVEAVATMNRIAEEVETDATYRSIIQAQRAEPEATGADAIADAARQIAETLDLAGDRVLDLLGLDRRCASRASGRSRRSSRSRRTSRPAASSSVVWGVHCVVAEDARDLDDMVDRACRLAFREGFAKAGQRIIIVAGVPLGTPGATNMVRIAFVGDAGASDAATEAAQISRPSTFSVRVFTKSGIFCRCGLTASARRNASSASFSSPNSCMITPRPDSAPKWRGSRASTWRMSASDLPNPCWRNGSWRAGSRPRRSRA